MFHTNPASLDQRLVEVHQTLSLAYQFLIALKHLDEQGTIDYDAVSALNLLVADAREHARVVADALPNPLGILKLADDYSEPSGHGVALTPILTEYRRRFGDDALAVAMNGRARQVGRGVTATASSRRSRKGA